MHHPIGLVIFDCDGVLVDTEPIAARINIAIGAELGWPLTEADVIDRFNGRSAKSISDMIAARLGPDVAAIWAERFELAHRQEVEARLTPVEGIASALDLITYPTCVASSGTHDKMRRTLGRTGLYRRFHGRIFSATEVARSKPAPDLFLYAAAKMGVPATACVVVEDSPPGVQAARAAGMRCLGYAGGLTPADRLEGPNTVVFDNMEKLPVLLDAL